MGAMRIADRAAAPNTRERAPFTRELALNTRERASFTRERALNTRESAQFTRERPSHGREKSLRDGPIPPLDPTGGRTALRAKKLSATDAALIYTVKKCN